MKNFLTFRALDSALLHKAGLNENDVIPALRATMINGKLMKIYRLLDGLNDPWYHKNTTVSSGADNLVGKDSGGAYTLSAVDATTDYLTKSSTGWSVGQLFTASFYNASSGARVCDFVGIITSVVATTQGFYSVITGSDSGMTLTGTRYTITEIKGPSTNVIDLSSTYVKDLLRIYDNGYTGGKVRLFTPIKDPAIFAVLHRDPYFDGRVAYFHRGDSVILYVGTSAAALGTIQMEYRGKPTPCTDFDSDVYIDIPPEDNQILMDEVLSEYLQAANKEVPPDVAARNMEFQKRYDSAMADLQKTQTTIKGVRGA